MGEEKKVLKLETVYMRVRFLLEDPVVDGRKMLNWT
jgi:hypothetical protein